MSTKPIIAIVGAGSLGVALANLLELNGYRVLLGSRKPSTGSQKLSRLFASQGKKIELLTPPQAVSQSDINLLTVPDKQISKVCDELLPHFRRGCCVAHCAGSLDSSELVSVKSQNIAVCSVHPLNTFPSIEAGLQTLANNSHGTYLYGEGDESALDTINHVFKTIGFHPRVIASASKPLYHAACVFACNYLTVLMDLSLQSAEAAGLDSKTFWQALQPLILKTIDNINDGDTVSALSGPVARADTSTINLHSNALAEVSAPLAATYLDLARHALALAVSRNELSETQVTALKQSLTRQQGDSGKP